jgi:hypothetical protein
MPMTKTERPGAFEAQLACPVGRSEHAVSRPQLSEIE